MNSSNPEPGDRSSGIDLQIVGVALALCVYFLAGAYSRLVEIDEGHYLMAAKQVMAGLGIYADFNHIQMPLFPYVWGLWMELFGFRWYVARTLAGLLAAAAGTLFFYHVRMRYGRRAARLALASLCVSGLVFGLQTIAKTHAGAALLLLLAYHLLVTSSREAFERRCFAAGLALGLTMGLRLMMIGALPALFYEIWLHVRQPGWSRRGFGLLCLGLLAGLLPNVPSALTDWHNFYWGNVVFHQIRMGDIPLISQLGQKLETALRLVGLNTAEGGTSVQFGLLSLLMLWNVGLCASERRLPDSAVVMAACLYVINLYPCPTFVQYHSYLVPFMLLGAVEVVTRCETSLAGCPDSAARKMLGLLFSTVLVVYMLAGSVEAFRFFLSGRDVDVVDLREEWTLPAVRAVGHAIDRWTEPGDPVFCRFTGYLLESHARPVPGTEVPFSCDFADPLSYEEAQRVKVLRRKDLLPMIRQRVPELVVLGNWTHKDFYTQALKESGYALVETLGRTELYKKPAP